MLVAASIATPATSPGCGQFNSLRQVFPAATPIGFAKREPIVKEMLRQPIWPGTCGKLFTRYHLGDGAIEVSVTLYQTHKQALVALAEPQYLPVDVLTNGAEMRVGIFQVWVNGTPKTEIGAVSVYRNVFVSSLEIARRPISAQAHVRLHLGIDARVPRLRQE
jgi:hypothetical protein